MDGCHSGSGMGRGRDAPGRKLHAPYMGNQMKESDVSTSKGREDPTSKGE